MANDASPEIIDVLLKQFPTNIHRAVSSGKVQKKIKIQFNS